MALGRLPIDFHDTIFPWIPATYPNWKHPNVLGCWDQRLARLFKVCKQLLCKPNIPYTSTLDLPFTVDAIVANEGLGTGIPDPKDGS